MTDLVAFLRAQLRSMGFWLRNAWAWPGVFQLGCWWEKRYRPERWEQPWREGVIVLPADPQAPDVDDAVEQLAQLVWKDRT